MHNVIDALQHQLCANKDHQAGQDTEDASWVRLISIKQRRRQTATTGRETFGGMP
jgi:hypothetical protein